MGIRSLVLLSIVAATFSLAPSAHAGTGGGTTTTTTTTPAGTGGTTTTTTPAAGTGGASGYDPNCTISQEQIAGTTCQVCDPTTSACGGLGSDYSLVCMSAANAAVYCNGPNRNVAADQNVACAVSVPGSTWGGFTAAAALAAAAALLMRRRR